MIKSLYILGNGFDLHHGLRSSYKNFSEFLRENDKKLYHDLEAYIDYPDSEDCLWTRFEENLANLNIQEILSDNSDYLPDIASEDFRDRDLHAFPDVMDQLYHSLTDSLVDAFQEFILQIKVTDAALLKVVEIDKDAKFLSFNYTNTLEKLYKIKAEQILYIHHSAYDANEQIILGHGIDPKNFEENRPEPPSGLNKDETEKWYQENDDWNYSLDTGKENLMKYFESTFKPTQQIIQSQKSFFKELFEIENVYVFGHSLSEIDMPYIREVYNNVNQNAQWVVSFYDDKARASHLSTLVNLGLNIDNIKLIQLEDIQLSNTQMNFGF